MSDNIYHHLYWKLLGVYLAMNTYLQNKDKRHLNAGFTLGELLVVAAIIGILVAVTVPIFFGYLQKSRETVCLSNRAAAKRMLLTEQIFDTSSDVARNSRNKKRKGYSKSISVSFRWSDLCGW